MSAFLGPIHELMYQRILNQEELTLSVVRLAEQQQWCPGLYENMEQTFGTLDTRPLTMVIDETNIHGWLNQVVRTICLTMLSGAEVPVADLQSAIEFIRHYADQHHHGKEEQLLFQKMQQHLGVAAEKLVRHGMLVEHDLARLYVSEWETALREYEKSQSEESKLDIITYASGYTKLLSRHIDREDTVVYTFARRELSDEVLSALHQATAQFEDNAAKAQVQKKYLALLEELEKRH